MQQNQKGADVNVRALGNRTPLHFAMERGNKKCVLLLLQAGAYPYARDNVVLFKETKRWQKNLTCLCSIIPLRQRLNFHQGHDPMGDWRDVKTVQIYVRKADVRNVWVGTAHIV